MLLNPLVDDCGNRRLALCSHHLERLLVAHGERQRERRALLVRRRVGDDGLLYLLLLGLAVGSVFLEHVRHGSTSFNQLHIYTIIHHRDAFVQMDNASDLRLFLREPRSLAHHAHQSKSRLRGLAASVELNHGLAGGSRLNERLGLG